MPKLHTKKRWLVFLVLVVGIVSVPIFYLNCSGAPASGNFDAASTAQSAPFAYQMQIDTLGYMSCGDLTYQQYDPSTFWSFKAAALRSPTAGISLTPDFIGTVQNESDTQQQQVLQATPLLNYYPDMSIRWANDVVDGGPNGLVYSSNQGGGDYYADANFLGSVTLGQFAQIFTTGTESAWHNSYSNSSSSNIPFSSPPNLTYLSYPGTGGLDSVPNSIRCATSAGTYSGCPSGETAGSAYLTTEFATAQTEQGVSVGGSPSEAYGYGYRFTYGHGHYQTGGPARAVLGVTEYNLASDTQTGSNWTCQNYEVVYPGDLGATITCPNPNGRTTPSSGNALESAVAQMLPGWTVDYAYGCAVPPSSATSGQFCEGTYAMHTSYSSGINYTTPTQYVGSSCSTASNNCPHIVSVCVRN